jgi:DNA modification methylase
MDLTTTIGRDGYLSVVDFRSRMVDLFIECGFVNHNEITIWKDPVLEVTRTKNIQLLYHQFCKDAAISRTALPDRLLIFRKDGVNKKPITHNKAECSPSQWGKIASPVWMDINQSKTLNTVKGVNDERHISALQLDVIERAIYLWSIPGDTVFSPFMGIGSEGYQSILMGRKFIGIELKEEYYRQSIKNISGAVEQVKQLQLI